MRILSILRYFSVSARSARVVDEQAPAADLLMRRHAEVGAHRQRQEQSLLLAVLGHEADAVADRVARRADRRPPAPSIRIAAGVERDRRRRSPAPSRCARRRPARRCRGSRRGAPRSVDVVEHGRVAVVRVAAPGKAFDRAARRRPAFAALRDGRRADADLPPDHQADDLVDARCRRPRRCRPAGRRAARCSDRRSRITSSRRWVTKMMPKPLRLEVADDAEQLLDLGGGQRRGRLVHHDQPRVHRQRAGDLDHLLLGDARVAHEGHRLDVEPEPAGDRPRVRGHLAPVRRTAAAPGSRPMKTFSAIVRFGSERELLIDRRDAEALGVVRASRGVTVLAGERDRARVRLLGAGQDLEQRRLAGAVLAEQRVNLARTRLRNRRRRAPARRESAC